jgi:hypothetical protein
MTRAAIKNPIEKASRLNASLYIYLPPFLFIWGQHNGLTFSESIGDTLILGF